jgi:hypothetical protein
MLAQHSPLPKHPAQGTCLRAPAVLTPCLPAAPPPTTPPPFEPPQKFGKDFDELEGRERQSVGGTIGGHTGGPKGGEARKEQLAAVSACAT